jgi:serine/threonine-protein kinase
MRAAAAARQAAEPPAKSRRGLVLAGVGVAMLVAAGAGAWAYTHRDTTPAGLSGDFAKNNVAVLYFEDRSPKKELGYLADGFTEAIIRDLTGIPQIKVISRNGVAPYRGKAVAPDSVARALKVGTLVNGTVTQIGDRVRVDVELVDALSGSPVDDKRLELPRDSIIALQDSLASELTLFLRKRVGGEIAALENRTGTTNSKAWEAMERAQQQVATADPLLAAGDASGAAGRLASADTMLTAVEKIDGQWARPIVQRGWIAYRTSRLLGPADPSLFPKYIDVGLAHAERALKLAPKDPDALELRGTLRYWSWLLNLASDPAASIALLRSAEADLSASTDANKAQATAWNSLSHLYLATSRTAQGKLAADNAYKTDPYLTDVDKTIWRLFISSVDLNLPTEAQRWCGEGQRRFAGNFRFVECQLWTNTFVQPKKPDVAAVWKIYDEYVKVSPPNVQPANKLRGRMIVALALIRAGLSDSARSVAVAARGNPQVDPAGDLTYLETIVRAQLGDKDEAIKQLTKYLAANPQQRAFTSGDESWWFEPIADDHRYKALVGAK